MYCASRCAAASSPEQSSDEETIYDRAKKAKESHGSIAHPWIVAARARKRGAEKNPLVPVFRKFDQDLKAWLAACELNTKLRFETQAAEFDDFESGRFSLACYYRFVGQKAVESTSSWCDAYHGTRWSALNHILKTGLIMESNDRNAGHEFGVSPVG